MNLYSQTSRQIDLLYLSLDEIRDNINTISGVNQTATSVQTRPRQRQRQRPRNIQQSNTTYPNSNPNSNPTMEYNYVLYPDLRTTATTNLPSNNYRFYNNYLSEALHSFNDSVPITPSPQVLTSATRAYRYSDIITPINTNCPITLDRFESHSEVTMILGCRHIFNTYSIHSWFANNVRCPVCRYDVRTYVVPTTTTTTEVLEEETKNDEPLNNVFNIQQYDNSNNLIMSGLSALGVNTGRFMFDASNGELVFEGFIPPRNNNINSQR
jgi:hypothetical protein